MKWHWLVLILYLSVGLICCGTKNSDVTVRTSYNCCDETCLDSVHRLRQEVLDAEDRVTSFIEYDTEGKPQLWAKLIYDESKLASRTDSSSLSFETTVFEYDRQGALVSRIVYRSSQMVFNETLDTIPHTEWRLVVDTALYTYTRNQARIDEWEGTPQDSMRIQATLLDSKNRVAEKRSGSLREKYFYTEFDSVLRVESWSFTASSSNTSGSDLKWRLLSSINLYYDSLNRPLRREIIDEQIEETIGEDHLRYDSRGRLELIASGDDCTRLVYLRRHR